MTEPAVRARMFAGDRFFSWLKEPVPVLRLELVRIAAPLCILGFMSSRIAYADEWLGDGGFRVPDLGVADPRRPLYLPSLPGWAAWAVAAIFVLSGLAVSLGVQARRAAWIFAAAATYVALSDRLAAFSVSKLAPMVGIALALSPCGVRFGIDAWKKKRAGLRGERCRVGRHDRIDLDRRRRGPRRESRKAAALDLHRHRRRGAPRPRYPRGGAAAEVPPGEHARERGAEAARDRGRRGPRASSRKSGAARHPEAGS
jgi:hypothetical protein